MEPASENVSGKIVTALIIGLLVGFAAGAFWQARRLSSPVSQSTAAVGGVEEKQGQSKADITGQPVNSTKNTPDVTLVETPKDTSSVSAKVTVSDQTAGNSVQVLVGGVTEPVWVAVREVTNGKLGNILGAQKVFIGQSTADVELLRSTVAGNVYRVVVYKDVGTPAFNYREDILVEGAEGTFTAK